MNSNSVILEELRQRMLKSGRMNEFIEYVRQCYVFNFDLEIENVE